MKWTSLLASLVLGLAASTPGYSFDLLDRMLGNCGCGCETSCCETKSCGCRSRCDRGCNRGCCAPTCTKAAAPYQAPSCTKAAAPYQEPTCATKAASPYQAPACGQDVVQKGGCGCQDRCGCDRGCFLSKLFSCNKCCPNTCHVDRCNKGCDTGCRDKCDRGCGGCNLFSGWGGCFNRCGCQKSCGCTPTCTKAASPYQAPSCGCDYAGGKAGVVGGDVAPMPPAPVVDPSAFIPTQRRVVQASSSLVR
jgi:hypothetical protein